MALNLEVIFRITTKVRDEGLAKLSQGLERAGEECLRAAKRSFKNVTDSAAWRGAAIAAAGIGVALIASVRSAIEFEFVDRRRAARWWTVLTVPERG